MAHPRSIATRSLARPGMVTLPTGHSISETEARDAGFTILSQDQTDAAHNTAARKAALSDVAIRLPGMPGRVTMPGYGTTSEEQARARGCRVMTQAEADAAVAQAAHDARVEQFTSLPEARGKVRSAARLAADYSAAEMPEARARAFLRGAPTDAAIAAQRQAPQPNATAPADDPRAARLAEIRRIGKRR